METAAFDTHQAVKAITGSGLNDIQAEAIVTTISNAMNQGLATKSDIFVLKLEIEALRTEIEAFKGKVTSDIKVLQWMVGVIIIVDVLPYLKMLFV